MAWAPEGSVNQKAQQAATPKKQTQWVARRPPHYVFDTARRRCRNAKPYFTSFQYAALRRHAKTVRNSRKINTTTPSWKRWPCAGSPIHCR